MAKYIKGEAVANATSYTLHNKNNNYEQLAIQTENVSNGISFDLDALSLAEGNYSLVVKAHSNGYEDSDYSNEVPYSIVDADLVLFDFDFVNNTLDKYVSDGIITIPSTSKTDTLVYDSKGLTTTGTATPAALNNGILLNKPFDLASRSWAFEVTMTMDPWQEDFGMTEALYPNLIFFSSADHDTLENGSAHSSNCLAPAIYINTGKFSGRFPNNGGTTIGTSDKSFTADGLEHTYRWVYNKDTNTNTLYKDDTQIYSAAWTAAVSFGGTMQYLLGAHNGYSSAKNFAIKKGYHIKSMKMYKI